MIKSFYVWRYNSNSRKIEQFNVFEHSAFYKYCMKAYKEFDKDKNYKKFSKQLDREARYYYWSKAEHEILVKAWVGGNGDEEEKIDIYDQMKINWDLFMLAAICELGVNEKFYDDKGELIHEK